MSGFPHLVVRGVSEPGLTLPQEKRKLGNINETTGFRHQRAECDSSGVCVGGMMCILWSPQLFPWRNSLALQTVMDAEEFKPSRGASELKSSGGRRWLKFANEHTLFSHTAEKKILICFLAYLTHNTRSIFSTPIILAHPTSENYVSWWSIVLSSNKENQLIWERRIHLGLKEERVLWYLKLALSLLRFFSSGPEST